MNANKNSEEKKRDDNKKSAKGDVRHPRSCLTDEFVVATALSQAARLHPHTYVRGAYAAGNLDIGFWDHWVPGANNTSTALVKEWAAKENVEVSIDYISSQGDGSSSERAEGQAKSGHGRPRDADMVKYCACRTTEYPSTISWSR